MRYSPSSHPTLAAAALIAASSAADGQSCIWKSHPGQPEFSTAGAVVYHSGLQRVVLIQTQGVLVGGVWAWDGAAWDLLTTGGPGDRWGCAAAYDSSRDRLVLFGGVDGAAGATYARDTWEWDRIAWTRTAISGPLARAGHSMVFDEANQRTTLFGGYAGGTLYHGDTWLWDGQSWTLAASSGPAPRSAACMAYDSLRARTMLYGGYGSAPPFADLWEWDGTVWTQRPSATPGPHASWMVFDPGRAGTFLGRTANSGALETWELNTAAALWNLIVPGSAPIGPAAFDPLRARTIVVYGASTWELDPAGTGMPAHILQQPVGGSIPYGGTIAINVQAGGTDLHYQWRHGTQPLIDDGRISGATTASLTIQTAVTADSGMYAVDVSNSCSAITSNSCQITVGGPPQGCYANCDNSTIPPYLNVNDFICFLNRFAAGDPYANCDNSCNPVCFNVLDFACFLNRFAAGCSAP